MCANKNEYINKEIKQQKFGSNSTIGYSKKNGVETLYSYFYKGQFVSHFLLHLCYIETIKFCQQKNDKIMTSCNTFLSKLNICNNLY